MKWKLAVSQPLKNMQMELNVNNLRKSLSSRKSVFSRRTHDFFYRFSTGAGGNIAFAGGVALNALGSKVAGLGLIMSAHRRTYSEFSFRSFLNNTDTLYSNLDRFVSKQGNAKSAVDRSIIIRWPVIEDNKIRRKGILIATFTETFPFFYREIDIELLTNVFHIVLEPSWAGYIDPDILFWKLAGKNPVFVQSSELKDRIALNALNSNLIPIEIGASDWVNPSAFYPLSTDKIYDSCYVANTKPGKRIHVYLEAIQNLINAGHQDYQGALICAAWGGKKEEIQKLVEYYRVEKNCQLFFDLDRPKLNQVLNNSKVNLLLSLKEGSNRSLFESMFANTPVIAIQDNIGTNKNYINSSTGILVYGSLLAHALMKMRHDWKFFSPRRWAMDNISPQVTTQKLATVISQYEYPEEREVDATCHVKTNDPEVQYFDYPLAERKDLTEALFHLLRKGNQPILNEVQELSRIWKSRIAPGAL